MFCFEFFKIWFSCVPDTEPIYSNDTLLFYMRMGAVGTASGMYLLSQHHSIDLQHWFRGSKQTADISPEQDAVNSCVGTPETKSPHLLSHFSYSETMLVH